MTCRSGLALVMLIALVSPAAAAAYGYGRSAHHVCPTCELDTAGVLERVERRGRLCLMRCGAYTDARLCVRGPCRAAERG